MSQNNASVHPLIKKARNLDGEDELASFRQKFHIPTHPTAQASSGEVSYLCGNSLGLQPKRVRYYLEEVMEDWRRHGAEGHFKGAHPWMPYHEFLTEKMAAVVGAKAEEVVVANSLSVNLHLLMVSFYRPQGKRVKIAMEANAFPSDIYAVKSQLRFHGFNCERDIVWFHPEQSGALTSANILDTLEANKDEIALVLLGGVNYLTGEVLEFKKIVECAHERGMLIGFDHAHAAGNLMLTLHDDSVDFATWCGYKYLNGGPGALSGMFVHSRHLGKKDIPRFEGWWGQNKQKRFQMGPDFDPIPTVEAWQLSNPPIFAMAPLMASLEIFSQVGMRDLNKKSQKLTAFLEHSLTEYVGQHVHITTPSPPYRGCQLSLKISNPKWDGPKITTQLTQRAVIGDFRSPNILRLTPVPLYNSFEDLAHASLALAELAGRGEQS